MSLTSTILVFIYLSWTIAYGSSLESPILQIRPTSPNATGLIWLDPSNQNLTQYYINDLNKFLEPYVKTEQSVNGEECQESQPPKKDKFCSFKVKENFSRCVSELGYGFAPIIRPCIFLQLTQFPKNWVPQFYNSTDELKDVPENLKSELLNNGQNLQQNLWVSCDGETEADKELIGPVIYFPNRGFPVNYLLNSQVEGYRSPLVAVYLPRSTRGILINIECTVWAKNIPRDPKLKVGTVQFGLLWDD